MKNLCVLLYAVCLLKTWVSGKSTQHEDLIKMNPAAIQKDQNLGTPEYEVLKDIASEGEGDESYFDYVINQDDISSDLKETSQHNRYKRTFGRIFRRIFNPDQENTSGGIFRVAGNLFQTLQNLIPSLGRRSQEEILVQQKLQTASTEVLRQAKSLNIVDRFFLFKFNLGMMLNMFRKPIGRLIATTAPETIRQMPAEDIVDSLLNDKQQSGMLFNHHYRYALSVLSAYLHRSQPYPNPSTTKVPSTSPPPTSTQHSNDIVIPGDIFYPETVDESNNQNTINGDNTVIPGTANRRISTPPCTTHRH